MDLITKEEYLGMSPKEEECFLMNLNLIFIMESGQTMFQMEKDNKSGLMGHGTKDNL